MLKSASFSISNYKIYIFLIFFMCLIFIVELIESFNVIQMSDSVLIHYYAFLIDQKGYIPYKDIVTINLPGTFIIHIILGNIFGYSSSALQNSNLLLLFLLAISIIISFKRLSLLSGILVFLIFGLNFLVIKENIYMQREFFLIIILSLIFGLGNFSLFFNRKNIQCLIQGLLFGIILLIKPQFFLFAPSILGYNYIIQKYFFNNFQDKRIYFLKYITFFLLGILLFFIPTLYWLYINGALSDFFYLFTNLFSWYKNFSLDLSQYHYSLFEFIKNYFRFGGKIYLVIGGFISLILLVFVYRKKKEKYLIYVVVYLFFISALLPIISINLYKYYFIPLWYFSAVSVSIFVQSAFKLIYLNKVIRLSSLFLILLSVINYFDYKITYRKLDSSYARFQLSSYQDLKSFFIDYKIKEKEIQGFAVFGPFTKILLEQQFSPHNKFHEPFFIANNVEYQTYFFNKIKDKNLKYFVIGKHPTFNKKLIDSFIPKLMPTVNDQFSVLKETDYVTIYIRKDYYN